MKKPIKTNFLLNSGFTLTNHATGLVDKMTYYFNSDVIEVYAANNVSEKYIEMRESMLEKIATFQHRGSGWQFDQVVSLDINISPFKLVTGSRYIPTPKKIGYRRAIVNFQNRFDHECFKWAVTSAVYPQKDHTERLSKELRENSEKFDWTDIDFPTPLKQIERFEKQNLDYVIIVYGYDEDFDILKACDNPDGKMIHLLLLRNEETEHYAWIKDFNRLMTSEVTNHKCAHEFCYRCFSHFQTKQKLEDHIYQRLFQVWSS